MSQLALKIELGNRSALVVGGGAVAERKIRTLLGAGAVVRVVAPQVVAGISAAAQAGVIELTTASYSTHDLDGVFLVVAATDDALVNRSIADDAKGRGLLVVVADQPEAGNCSFSALLRRGDLEIAVSTNGTCPAFASEVRDLIAEHISEEFGTILERLAAEREKLLTEGSPSTYNTTILRSRARELIDELTHQKE